ncbi:MAG: sulfurtransferase complex subunit TusC [bacterium]
MKKFLFVLDKPPHGSVTGQEALDAILMGSAFTQCSVLFLRDGLYQVLGGQDTTQLATKDYSVTYKALADYGVTGVYCRQSHLGERKLDTSDLAIAVQALSEAEVKQMFVDHDVILSF